MEPNESLDELKKIRSLMERSGRFLSLSGLSGVVAGAVALVGGYLAHIWFGIGYIDQEAVWSYGAGFYFWDIIALALGIILMALTGAYYFTYRKSKARGEKLWSAVGRRVALHTAVPLVAGGICCFILLMEGHTLYLAPFTLVFYGLSLVSAGQFTHKEIVWMGYTQLLLGLIGMAMPGYGLLLWSLGFGIFHMIYGVVMYVKYDQ